MYKTYLAVNIPLQETRLQWDIPLLPIEAEILDSHAMLTKCHATLPSFGHAVT